MSSNYIPICPFLIFYDLVDEIDVYKKLSNDYMLYARHGCLTELHKKKLYDNDVNVLYINSSNSLDYNNYIEKNFGRILLADNIPLIERSKIFYEYTKTLLENAYDERLPNILNDDFLIKLKSTVDLSCKFLSNNGSFGNISKLISHNYNTFTHSIHVCVYTLAILHEFDMYSEEKLRDIGMGAILHDLGKKEIPNSILEKRGRLTDDERFIINKHPLYGSLQCREMNVNNTILNCILYHHEKLDASGYPCGIDSSKIPFYVKVVTIADIYDALVSERPYAKAMTPFEALKIISRDADNGKLDKEIVAKLIGILYGKKIT